MNNKRLCEACCLLLYEQSVGVYTFLDTCQFEGKRLIRCSCVLYIEHMHALQEKVTLSNYSYERTGLFDSLHAMNKFVTLAVWDTNFLAA